MLISVLRVGLEPNREALIREACRGQPPAPCIIISVNDDLGKCSFPPPPPPSLCRCRLFPYGTRIQYGQISPSAYPPFLSSNADRTAWLLFSPNSFYYPYN